MSRPKKNVTPDEVLLYYKYVSLEGKQEQIRDWLQERCSVLELRGRVRVALDGLNATLTGAPANLQVHMRELSSHPCLEPDQPIDFKRAAAEATPTPAVTLETGMHTLSVKLCKEVVSLGPRAGGMASSLYQSAQHVSPEQFHRMLEEANSARSKKVVLLDVRNLYESRIGVFQASNVETLVPPTRTFSSFPEWVDEHLHLLRGKEVMMYCTGGVRCERASAYVRHQGEGFQNVKQLSGGIQRYLEAFPDGGFFRGKNFVFDERIAVGSETRPTVVGTCVVCHAPYDDYRSRSRCVQCRMLMLVCDHCRARGDHGTATTTADDNPVNQNNTTDNQQPNTATSTLSCELCTSSQRPQAPSKAQRLAELAQRLPPPAARLRLLCLHGFRSSAEKLRGRTNGLRRRLKIVDMAYIDAPHVLHMYYRSPLEYDAEVCTSPHARPATHNLPKRPRMAWLIAPGTVESPCSTDIPTSIPECFVNGEQHKEQTLGWDESLRTITEAIREKGPFDGLMGFSQGCAAVAVICALQEQEARAQAMSADGSNYMTSFPPFKFAMLCSGYASYAPEHRALFQCVAPMNIPSLHIFGTEGNDRQIDTQENEELVELFSPNQRTVVRHGAGHIIPTGKTMIAQYTNFLEQFVSTSSV